MILNVLAVLLIVLPVTDWAVWLILYTVSRQNPSILTLRERAIAALLCAIVASIAAGLAWSRFGVVVVPNSVAIILLALGLVIASVPSLYWLWLLLTGRFWLGRS